MTVAISTAVPADALVLARLGKFVHDLHVAWYPDIFRPMTEEELRDEIGKLLLQPNFKAFLAKDNGAPVGHIGVRAVDRPGNQFMKPRRFLDVEQIGVAPETRGKGIGRELLKAATEFARGQGMTRIELNVWAQNAAARKAFAAWGFRTYSDRMGLEL